ncbi:MAG: hypothetical protein CMJ98_01740 [Planctomycetes bacterium]|nr:hypothetical protein [Planctomycetota bacterium]
MHPLLISALLCAVLHAPEDVRARAQELIDQDNAPGAVELLERHLKLEEGDAQTLELFGRALSEVERKDEAAHWLGLAREQFERAKSKRDLSRVEKALAKVDPLAKKRIGFTIGLVRDLTRAGDKLVKGGQVERGLELYHRALPLAEGEARDELESAIEEIISADTSVDLDAAGTGAGNEGGHELYELETDHYRLRCNLEQPVVELLGVTLDDLFANYVDIYFDGDSKRAPSTRPTVRIHGTWDDMAALWTDGEPSPGLGGWWSPGSLEIHTFDGRTRGGSLQETLETLFHEGSHQFMSAFVKGNQVPTWFNEGTACFFEGAQAMTDGRVLWPDVARGRLSVLTNYLYQDNGPKLAEVLAYPGPGSYPFNFYCFGWGLVYFLQQWEDPETLRYAYRPLYRRYLDESMGHSTQGLQLFEQIILGEDDPLGHADLAAFEETWKDWILNTVQPFHLSLDQQQLERRSARAQRYLEAAETVSGKRKAPVTEEELLLRALGDLEFARARMTESSKLQASPLLDMVDVLEKLDRPRAAATVLEQFLDAVDDGELELGVKEYETANRRLEGLDRGNYALRSARSRMKTQYKRMHGLLTQYRELDPPLPLRAHTYASQLNDVFADFKDWSDEASALHEAAKEAGLIPGKLTVLTGPPEQWMSIQSDAPKRFEVAEEGFELASVQPHGRIHKGVELGAEYELRGRITRRGETHRGTAHGLVVCGAPEGDWFCVGIGHEGNVRMWHLILSAPGSTRLKPAGKIVLETPIPSDAQPVLGVRVSSDGSLEVSIDGVLVGQAQMGFATHTKSHVGVFVRDGEMRVDELVVSD